MNFIKRYLFLTLVLLSILGCHESIEKQPNIILIMADDMGYSDIGCYGGEVKTPNLDGLAQNGLRFTQFYNNARCCPTRASLLTGLYPHQAGIGYMVDGSSKHPAYQGDLNNDCVTIAEVLKENGYSTYMTGKWHVAKSVSPDDKHNWPNQRGFQKFFGTITGAGSYFDPATLTSNNNSVEIKSEDNFYYTDAISDSTVTFLQKHFSEKPGKPFFFYVAYTAPHWPLHALEEDIEKYNGVYSKGWDEVRESRFKRMKEIGIIDPNWKLSKRDEQVPKWEDAEKKNWEERRMMTYAAQIDNMDQGIGRILDQLKKEGELDNTLIIFLADNGGCAESFNSDTEWIRRYGPKTTFEGNEVIYGNDNELPAGSPGTYMSYATPWANVSNSPFRKFKHYGYEGGVSTPFIVHWPKGFTAKNKFQKEVGSMIDVMPTILDAADIDYPSIYKDNTIQPVEGESLLPVFQGERLNRNQWFMEHGGNRAYRKNNWKIVGMSNNKSWELYNLKEDRTETVNLATEFPEKLDSMSNEWEQWAWRVKVFPKD